jgi:hypothetical protein
MKYKKSNRIQPKFKIGDNVIVNNKFYTILSYIIDNINNQIKYYDTNGGFIGFENELELYKEPKKLVKFNINDEIQVELTDFGKEKIKEYFENEFGWRYQVPEYIKKQLNNKFQTFQLWDFMQCLGKEFYNGGKTIIKHNDIIINNTDLKEYYED